MRNLSYIKIREEYINFFKSKNHREIPSASLIPEDDPSVLFVNAGMFPLVPFLKGEPHPLGKRLTNSQRCIRTGDIDMVGDATHCTAFEMLGNWSLNDYFKQEAIELTVEFLVKILQLDINRIYASVFKGEGGIPKDEESIKAWREIFSKYGIDAKVGPNQRIQEFGKENNWWGLESGGPCGPDSEIFYDTEKQPCSKGCNLNCECGKYVEIGNNVFMEYLLEDNIYKPLGRHNVDFGGGLVRYAMISQDVDSIYETDIYNPIFKEVKELSSIQNTESQRIVTDHILASCWIIMDGVKPSNTMQGYVLRKLIRRSMRHSMKLEMPTHALSQIATISIEQFKSAIPKLEKEKNNILNTLQEEEQKFNKTLHKGLKELDRLITKRESISGEEIFKLYETYGLPKELTEEILNEKNIGIRDEEGYHKAEKQHQKRSELSTKGIFKGGLADTSEMSIKYHTATHLLLASLRKILGEHIYQKGSNISPERLRLDFPNDNLLTDEEIQEVEDMVNRTIAKGLDISFKEVTKEEALKTVPFSPFEEKYGDTLKLYYVGDITDPFSVEICNGPHVSNTSVLGKFKIVKQESIGSGIKRIKAILQ
ncbi:alanine--tRNA ligase [Candidatus Dojkabacteria bacterium]|uniref:alanine--tRNA ligase n=1 Tax=Candidatus Dojkabacteria bacterium TaxID=2099670 RepID=A0A847VCK4_9BACT|nr:alanine--tRNA ligase [Candidatus Dojkabacteria bacterium]